MGFSLNHRQHIRITYVCFVLVTLSLGQLTLIRLFCQLRDTASYRINESASEARRHAVAITFLLLMLPSTAVKGSNTVGYNMDLLRQEKRRAEDYADAVDGGLSRKRNIVRADFRAMRTGG